MNELGIKFLKPVELAKALGISRATLYELIRKGILPQGVKLGRSRRWSISDIQAALDSQKGERA